MLREIWLCLKYDEPEYTTAGSHHANISLIKIWAISSDPFSAVTGAQRGREKFYKIVILQFSCLLLHGTLDLEPHVIL